MEHSKAYSTEDLIGWDEEVSYGIVVVAVFVIYLVETE